jgi:hypothetical protein
MGVSQNRVVPHDLIIVHLPYDGPDSSTRTTVTTGVLSLALGSDRIGGGSTYNIEVLRSRLVHNNEPELPGSSVSDVYGDV